MAYLTLKNINKIYPNGFHAVHNFNLDIEKGEFVVFVGPSGCGKSTTLRMIAGLEDISSGEFLINGDRANEKGPREREIAMVFQSYALYPQMTVYDNIAFGLTLQGVDEKDARERASAVIERFGLPADEAPFSLSRGQRQMVALASVVVMEPEVVLLDEPTSGLDYRECMTVMDTVSKMAERGCAVIMVCHDMEVVSDFAERIVVMADEGAAGHRAVRGSRTRALARVCRNQPGLWHSRPHRGDGPPWLT